MSPEFALKIGPELLQSGWDLARQGAKIISDRLQYDFRVAHTNYCINVVKKYCNARTFFVREPPQYIDDFYVPASVIQAKKKYERASLASLEALGRRCIVRGSGGSGKTIFMRKLLLDAVELGAGYPVFVELRHYNEVPKADINLRKIISDLLVQHGFPLDDSFAQKSLNEGLLVLILDGFDEVEASRRKTFERQIREIASATSSQIVLSSRPDITLQDWHGFVSCDIAPLGLDEACELIEKINLIDEDGLRQRFSNRLRKGLFKTHEYFLSNPLLLSIMLITYGDSADIPRKSATFYEYAYIALFQKHDALKSGFKRPRKTDLDVSEFARLFSAFSAITYDKRAMTFSPVDAITYMDQAIRVSGVRKLPSEDIIEDAKQAVCLLIDDGLDVSYVHRSFQEYFAARFINEADQSVKEKYIAKLSLRDGNISFEVDNVLKLLYEMTPSLIEDHFLIPGLSKLFGVDASRKMSYASWRRVIKKILRSVSAHGDQSLSFSIKGWPEFRLYMFVAKICNSQSSRRKSDAELVRMLLEEGGHVQLSELPERAPIWSELADVANVFSLDVMEMVRLEFVGMRRRAADRSQVVDSLFS